MLGKDVADLVNEERVNSVSSVKGFFKFTLHFQTSILSRYKYTVHSIEDESPLQAASGKITESPIQQIPALPEKLIPDFNF